MPDHYIVLDFETTGLSPVDDRILEIGAVRVDFGQITERFETFVNPHRRIPCRITELTGITEEMLQGAPDMEEVFPELLNLLGDLPLVGHNIQFDFSFLKMNAVRFALPFEKNALDTLKIAKKALPDLESRSLEALCSYYHIARNRAHRALDDVCETQELFRILRDTYQGEHPEWFQPEALCYRVKKVSPITPAQKRFLTDLCRQHHLVLDAELDSLSKSEASRRIDQILSTYGR